MAKLVIVDRAGDSKTVEADAGLSVMEVIRENGFDEMLALCGGCCSCATCHVYIDEDYNDRLPPVSDDENDLLDSSEHRTGASRLSCQIAVSNALDGLTVRIAPQD